MSKNYIPVAKKRLRAAANRKNLEFLAGKDSPHTDGVEHCQIPKPSGTGPKKTVPVHNADCLSDTTDDPHKKRAALMSVAPKLDDKNVLHDINVKMERFGNSKRPKKRTALGSIPPETNADKVPRVRPDNIAIATRKPVNIKTEQVGSYKVLKKRADVLSVAPVAVSKSLSILPDDEGGRAILESVGLEKVQPNVNKQIINIQMKFMEDWKDPEPESVPGHGIEEPEHEFGSDASSLSKPAHEADCGHDNPVKPVHSTYPPQRKRKRSGTEPNELLLPAEDDKESGDHPLITVDCQCGQQATVTKLMEQIETLKKLNKKLKKAYDEATRRSLRLTDSLSSKILENPQKSAFSEFEGFPNRELLTKISNQAADNDYTFVRLLLKKLWPEGFTNRSVTGRGSNNPMGRPRGGVQHVSEAPRPAEVRVPLEPEKVKYVRARLLEHRICQGDTPAVASTLADEFKRLMSRVIAYYGKDRSQNSLNNVEEEHRKNK